MSVDLELVGLELRVSKRSSHAPRLQFTIHGASVANHSIISQQPDGVALLLEATLSARRTRLPGGAGGFVLALLGASCASNGYQERDSRWPQGRGGHANGVRDR
jgi:hypothetical protein